VVIAPHGLDASGADATRPVWTGILDAACAGEYGLVVVAKFDGRRAMCATCSM
jgi:hypothetical protein